MRRCRCVSIGLVEGVEKCEVGLVRVNKHTLSTQEAEHEQRVSSAAASASVLYLHRMRSGTVLSCRSHGFYRHSEPNTQAL